MSQGLEDHSTASISFADIEGNKLPFRRKDFKPFEGALPIPDNFPLMKEIAEKLAAAVDNTFVRIDLYSACSQVYFSEFTFYPCGGLIPFEPEEWDAKLGEMLSIKRNV